MSTPKKAKTTDDGSGVVDPAHALHLSQLSTLRQYVESCPHVPRNCAAVRAALAGLDGELKRAERDERLRQKFAREKRVSEEEAERARREAEEEDDEEGMGDEGRFVGKDSKGVRPMDDDDDVDDGEWQSVPSPASPPPPAASTSSSLRTSPEIVDPAALAAAAASTASPSSSLLFPPSSSSAAEETPLGRDLASASIAAMARSGTRVAAPLAAVALALHGAVTSDLVGFRCTGVPDDDDDDDDDESGQQGGQGGKTSKKKKKKKGGFAPPIRELPKTKFVPDLWDARAGGPQPGAATVGRPRVSLRYRKDGLGTTILRVVLLPPSDDDGPASDGGGDDTADMMVEGGNDDGGGVSGSGGGGGGERVRVRLTSTSTGGSSGAAEPGGPGGRQLIFPLGRHVNLDGLRKGMETAGGRGGIEPALHYKALAGLMTDFCRAFDLGGVDDTSSGGGAVCGGAVAAAVVGTGTAPVAGGRSSAPVSGVPTVAPDGGGGNDNGNGNGGGDLRPAPGRSPLIDDFGTGGGRNMPGGGDFAGDLAPGGIVDPRLTGGRPGLGGGTGGSLMGPNHPAFRDGTYAIGDDYDDLVGGGGGGVGDDPRMPHIGGTGMQPRFDPFYPPGVGPDPGRGIGGGRGGRGMGGRGRGRGRGGRGRAPPSGGDPNPDHQRPPSDHMFM